MKLICKNKIYMLTLTYSILITSASRIWEHVSCSPYDGHSTQNISDQGPYILLLSVYSLSHTSQKCACQELTQNSFI